MLVMVAGGVVGGAGDEAVVGAEFEGAGSPPGHPPCHCACALLNPRAHVATGAKGLPRGAVHMFEVPKCPR